MQGGRLGGGAPEKGLENRRLKRGFVYIFMGEDSGYGSESGMVDKWASGTSG